MNCLSCGAAMVVTRASIQGRQVTYESCPRCASLWLDRGTMDKVAARVRGSIEYSSQEPVQEPQPRHWKCPRCDNSDLIAVRFLDCTDIILHHCRACGGYWLDGGELEQMDQELRADGSVIGDGLPRFLRGVHMPHWRHGRAQAEVDREAPLEVMPIAGAQRLQPTQHLCPACGGMLSAYRAFHVGFEACPACKGVWLNAAELRTLKAKTTDANLGWMNQEINHLEDASAAESPRMCPLCPGQHLVSTLFGHSALMIDWCPQCHGLWLDRNEFTGLQDYLRDEMAGMKASNIEAQLHALGAELAHGGGGESRREELRDAHAALRALVSATIFEHPALRRLCLRAMTTDESLGA